MIERLLAELREAAIVFRRYEQLHAAKGTPDGHAKAEANREIACRFEATVAEAERADRVARPISHPYDIRLAALEARVLAVESTLNERISAFKP